MSFLLDTMVISEGTKRLYDRTVANWLISHSLDIYISVVSIAELRDGIERLPEGWRRQQLDHWYHHDVLDDFDGYILDIGVPEAQVCGRIMARVHEDKVRAATNDIWIAAIALHHEMTVVTRNTRDFDGLGVPTINPWEFGG